MEEKVNEKELWELIGYIKISQSRYMTLKSLEHEFLMPSEISRRTELRIPQVSTALHQLKDKKLVICKNEHLRKGRIYESTPLGLTILDIIDKNDLIHDE